MKVLTANRLTDGEAVWYAPSHRWSETLAGAEVARDKAHAAAPANARQTLGADSPT